MLNNFGFIRNNITPVTEAIETSIIRESAMLENIFLIVKASENLVVISPVFLEAKNFIGSLQNKKGLIYNKKYDIIIIENKMEKIKFYL